MLPYRITKCCRYSSDVPCSLLCLLAERSAGIVTTLAAGGNTGKPIFPTVSTMPHGVRQGASGDGGSSRRPPTRHLVVASLAPSDWNPLGPKSNECNPKSSPHKADLSRALRSPFHTISRNRHAHARKMPHLVCDNFERSSGTP